MDGWVRRAALVTAVSLGGALASCGGGGGGGGSGGGGEGETLSGDWLPLTAGARWFYAVDGDTAYPARVVGSGSTGTVSGTLVESTIDGIAEQTLYTVAADGIRQYAVPAPSDALGRALDGLKVLALPVRAGDAYTQLDTTVDSGEDFDGDGRNERIQLHVEVEVIGLETVTTPAGTFANALRQRQSITEKVDPTGGGRSVTVEITVDTWYGDGIGPLQTSVRIAGPGIDETSVERLTAYGVGNRRSETVAPTVTAVTPARPVRAFAATVAATLSETADPHSLGATTIVVRDAAGAAVAGGTELQADGTTLRFVPAAPLLPGAYTATLDGVTDLVGNPLAAPRTWTITIDETAPGVVATSPANNAVDVPVGPVTITIDFSEPIDPALTTAVNTRLFDDTSAEIPVTVSVAGNRLTIVAQQPLAYRRAYTVQTGAWDLAGNPLGYVYVFRTVQGRFAAPVDLIAEAQATATAIADVNGDGIADVLLGTHFSAPPAYASGVFLLAGRADGTFAAPLRLPVTPPAGCLVTSIATGDFDGDGRTDVAVAVNGCGVQVLKQTAAGALVAAEFLPRYDAFKLVAADVDRDGKLDLLAGGLGITVQIWKRDAGGAMAASGIAILGSSSYAILDFGVGDIDGDGRPDIAAALILGQPGQDIAVLRQLPGGMFAPETVSSASSFFGVNRIAVGDLDGDGRAEVVASTAATFSVLYRPDATGALGAPIQLPGIEQGLMTALADVDNDGRLDIVTGHYNPNRAGVRYQRVGGAFSAEDVYVGSVSIINGGNALAVGDVTRDGRRDILLDGQLISQFADAGNGKRAAKGEVARGGRRPATAALRDALRR